MNHRREKVTEQKQRREERRDALENRQQILQTAEALFSERDIEAVTMTEIAKAAGVGQGTLYRHFAHKGELLEALLSPHFERFQEEAIANFGYEQADSQPLQLVYLFLMRFAYFIEEHTAHLQALYRAYQTQGRRSFYQCAGHQWNKERVKYYLQNAVEVGACSADLDSDYLAESLLAVIQVDLYLYQRHTLDWSEERIVNGLAQLLEGLAKHSLHLPEQMVGRKM
ncbi:TetR/AcrR family transcriptional regulator [Ktedonobacter robiniae]|uniref:TetR family transcriptional regulator n=1 Tax=Ktedonobacter robiniae TaxID=2778365 RepID=A0ABQ3UXL3_9CHLR|nr:TetR/AcrR family transcriptional regulator [Ktedonobacter robiniae]GHO57055.1 TetR family transcriptional regulator [Ktedonobacter robiniae]